MSSLCYNSMISSWWAILIPVNVNGLDSVHSMIDDVFSKQRQNTLTMYIFWIQAIDKFNHEQNSFSGPL